MNQADHIHLAARLEKCILEHRLIPECQLPLACGRQGEHLMVCDLYFEGRALTVPDARALPRKSHRAADPARV